MCDITNLAGQFLVAMLSLSLRQGDYNLNGGEKMYFKKIIRFFIILMLGLSAFVFSGCGFRSNDFADRVSDFADNLAETIIDGAFEMVEESFLVYEEFGLIFDSETRNLYYDNEQVTFFEDSFEGRRGLNNTTFGDRNGRGLHIHAQRDSNGDLTGLELTRR